LAKVNVPISKKRKLGPKTVDCVFLGYAHHSIAYRFLVVKSEVSDMHVDIIFESRDATFFENIFPMKDMCSVTPQVFGFLNCIAFHELEHHSFMHGLIRCETLQHVFIFYVYYEVSSVQHPSSTCATSF
jgi:hypothetical protein